jgi:hypothetical protein
MMRPLRIGEIDHDGVQVGDVGGDASVVEVALGGQDRIAEAWVAVDARVMKT